MTIPPQDRKDLDILRLSLGQWCLEGKVKDYLEKTSWEYFSFAKICKGYSDYKDLIISNGQKEQIRPYCEELFDSIGFEEYKDNQHYLDAEYLAFAITNFGFCCDDERLLKMLYLPYYLFYENKNSYETALIELIIDRISDKQKLQSILFDSFKNNPTLHLKGNFIAYCKINNLPEAVEVAVEMLKCNDEYMNPHTLIEYIQAVKGSKYFDDMVAPDANLELLQTLAYYLIEDSNVNLLKRLKDENEKSENKTQHLAYLIKHDARHGLKIYLELIKTANAIPEKSDDGVISSITDSIRNVDSSDVIDIISELIRLSHAPDFKDNDFGLKSVLGEAISNIFRNNSANYEKVYDMLTDIGDGSTNNGKLTSYCNWHLERLKREKDILRDTLPCKIEDVKEFLDFNRR